jgi:hypothetical protein
MPGFRRGYVGAELDLLSVGFIFAGMFFLFHCFASGISGFAVFLVSV